jgi:hypothetical protein
MIGITADFARLRRAADDVASICSSRVTKFWLGAFLAREQEI